MLEAACRPHEKLVWLLGRLRFRTSYSQNCLQHSIEVARLAGMMAAEVGADASWPGAAGCCTTSARRANHEMEGGHPTVAWSSCPSTASRGRCCTRSVGPRRGGAGDRLYGAGRGRRRVSAARPGARRDMLENYVKRVKDMEEIACWFPGVERPTRSRRAASSGSSPSRIRSRTSTPTSSPRTSPSGSRPRCSTPVTSR